MSELMVGMLWFDGQADGSLEDKLRKAAAHYERKYGAWPTICHVDAGVIAAETELAGMRVVPSRLVARNHLWIGRAE